MYGYQGNGLIGANRAIPSGTQEQIDDGLPEHALAAGTARQIHDLRMKADRRGCKKGLTNGENYPMINGVKTCKFHMEKEIKK